jgi:hypothetical protein
MPDLIYGAPLIELERRFGGMLREVPADVTVGTSSAEAVGRDPERVFLLVVNLSANDVFIRPNGPASSTSGIRLEPNGGGFTVNSDQDGTLPMAEWHAIATAAGSAVFTLAVRRETVTKP